jgi:hypothetical protein
LILGGTVANLTAAVDGEVMVDHGAFDLIDDAGPQRARIDYQSPSKWVCAGDNSVIVRSASRWNHVATLRVEAWDGPPPPASGWDEYRDETVRLDSGLIEINPLVEGDTADSIEVGPAGLYRVRVHIAGREELVALDAIPDEELQRGVERFLIQFWPCVG